MASGPKGSSKDDSSFDYTAATANGDYAGTFSLQMRHICHRLAGSSFQLHNSVFGLTNHNIKGPETLTIMRRSSSKRKNQRALAASSDVISELDDSALERTIAIVDDDNPIDPTSNLPSAEICENASLRYVQISLHSFRKSSYYATIKFVSLMNRVERI